MLFAQVHEPPESLGRLRADVPPDLAAIVMRCLAKSADDRFPSAGALAESLAGSLSGRT